MARTNSVPIPTLVSARAALPAEAPFRSLLSAVVDVTNAEVETLRGGSAVATVEERAVPAAPTSE
jgi:hypothetical protein